MNDTEDVKTRQAVLVEKIDNLQVGFEKLAKELADFTHTYGYKVDKHDTRITVAEEQIKHSRDEIADIKKLGWAIFGSSLMIVLAAFWKLIIK